jgi:predicted RNA binding protein YcfA (HicA-like mRNA interferase family)
VGNNRPVKKKDWIRFLRSRGCVERAKKGNSGSHTHWKCPNCYRTITFRINEKEIPPVHLQTNLSVMGLKLADLYDWLDKNK